MTDEQGGGASRSTDVTIGPPGYWTLEAYVAHNEALRRAEERFLNERDRRYTEVGVEREKALKIKESADEAARVLVAENQAYRDEKANELRSQIERERGLYVTRSDLQGAVDKIDATLKPLLEYVSAQSGPRAVTPATLMTALIAVSIVVGLYLGLR